MNMKKKRIQNIDTLSVHGNIQGRKAMLEILETGLQAVDPYDNTRKLIRISGDRLVVGGKKFEPRGSPGTGDEVIDLSRTGNIYVIGAGKGIQRVAKAIEDSLGDRLSGGHVIDKKGHPVILKKIGVTLGGHPIPDDDCILGCQKILEVIRSLSPDDIVFTCVSNGVSSLLTMPVPGVTLDNIKKMTYIMQVKLGAPTQDLNPIRNHLDVMKGGRISRYIRPAKAIHIIALEPGNYDQLIYRNQWLQTLPDRTTFSDAIANLKKWDAWESIPASIREFLEFADPKYETVKAEEFVSVPFRIFGVMPGFRQTAKLFPAMKKAEELGFKPVILTDVLFQIDAAQAGRFLAAICKTIEHGGYPFKPPCALFISGEMTVAVGDNTGIGGRNQEFALSAAQLIAGCENTIIASVDTDGTGGPGNQFTRGFEDMPSCLAGGIVDGQTAEEAKRLGINIDDELKKHNSSPPLWKLDCGIVATPNISLVDLSVALVLGQSNKESHLYY